jgi:acetyl esterase
MLDGFSSAADSPRAINAEAEDRVISGGPKGRISLRIVRPRGSARPPPIVVYFHGGDCTLGNEEAHARLIREIADGANAAVVFLDYNASLDVSSAIAIEEAYAATRWIAQNGRALGMDATRLAVAGDSIGGQLSAAVAQLAKERGVPRISAQVLFYPATETNQGTAAADAPGVSPLRASVDQLRGLPPSLVIASGLDALRGEGEAYADKLAAAGVTVSFTRYLGVLHNFLTLGSGDASSAARAAIAQANAMLRRAFAS